MGGSGDCVATGEAAGGGEPVAWVMEDVARERAEVMWRAVRSFWTGHVSYEAYCDAKAAASSLGVDVG